MAYDNRRNPDTDDFMFDMDDDPFDDDRLDVPGARRNDYQGGYRDDGYRDRYRDGYQDDAYRNGRDDGYHDDGYSDDRYRDGYRDARYRDDYPDDRYRDDSRRSRYHDDYQGGYRDDRRHRGYMNDEPDMSEKDSFTDPFDDDDPFDEFDEPFSDEDSFDDSPSAGSPVERDSAPAVSEQEPERTPKPKREATPRPKTAAAMPDDAHAVAPSAKEAPKTEQPTSSSALGGTVAFALSQLRERQRIINVETSVSRHISESKPEIVSAPEPSPMPEPSPATSPSSTGTATLDRPRGSRTEQPADDDSPYQMTSEAEGTTPPPSSAEPFVLGEQMMEEPSADISKAEPASTDAAEHPDYIDDDPDDLGTRRSSEADASDPEPEDDFGDEWLLGRNMSAPVAEPDPEPEDDFGDEWLSGGQIVPDAINATSLGIAAEAEEAAEAEHDDETYHDPFGQDQGEIIAPGNWAATATESAAPTYEWNGGQAETGEAMPESQLGDADWSIDEALLAEATAESAEPIVDENADTSLSDADETGFGSIHALAEEETASEAIDEVAEEIEEEAAIVIPTVPTDEDGWPIEGIGLKVPKPRFGSGLMNASMAGSVLIATMEDIPDNEVHAYVEQLASLGFNHGRVDNHGANGGYVFAATDSNMAGGATVMVSRHFDGFVRIFANEGWDGDAE